LLELSPHSQPFQHLLEHMPIQQKPMHDVNNLQWVVQLKVSYANLSPPNIHQYLDGVLGLPKVLVGSRMGLARLISSMHFLVLIELEIRMHPYFYSFVKSKQCHPWERVCSICIWRHTPTNIYPTHVYVFLTISIEISLDYSK